MNWVRLKTTGKDSSFLPLLYNILQANKATISEICTFGYLVGQAAWGCVTLSGDLSLSAIVESCILGMKNFNGSHSITLSHLWKDHLIKEKCIRSQIHNPDNTFTTSSDNNNTNNQVDDAMYTGEHSGRHHVEQCASTSIIESPGRPCHNEDAGEPLSQSGGSSRVPAATTFTTTHFLKQPWVLAGHLIK